MKWKVFQLTALFVLSAAMLAGCGEKKAVDPYMMVSLHQAMYGPPAPSKGFKYKIVGAEVVEAVNHLALVRDGNVVEFIVGRSIEDKMEGKQDIVFNVVKKYSPFVHLKAEQLIAQDDTTFMPTAGSIYYPRITMASEFNSRDHEEVNLLNVRYDRSEFLQRLPEKKFSFADMPLEWDDEEGAWMLIGPRARFRVAQPNDHMELILRRLAAEGFTFSGGVTFTEVDEWATRQQSQVAGTVEVDYVAYMGRVFSG